MIKPWGCAAETSSGEPLKVVNKPRGPKYLKKAYLAQSPHSTSTWTPNVGNWAGCCGSRIQTPGTFRSVAVGIEPPIRKLLQLATEERHTWELPINKRRFNATSSADDRNPASPCIYTYVLYCQISYACGVYKVYIRSCRIC